MNFLDFIFPKNCVSCGRFGAYICKPCFSKIEFVEKPVCAVCSRQAIGGKTHPGCLGKHTLDGLVVACKYRGPIRVAVKKIKYRWVGAISLVLVDLLVTAIWRYDIPEKAILVPIPLHKSRKNWRGFNQAELLAIDLSKRFNVVADVYLLQRTRKTKTQVGLSREERQKNIKGAFSLVSRPELKGSDYILIDDVFTTGATMAEAAKVLKIAGAESVWAMTVALD